MPLYKLPNFGLGHLRAKLAEHRTARAAKKAGNPRRKRDSAGPKIVASPVSPSNEIFEEKKVECPEQPPPSPHTNVRTSTPISAKAILTTTLASQIMTFIITPISNEAVFHLGFREKSPIRSETIQIGMTPLEQPWYARRRSSLMRLSASNMRISDSVKSPRRPASRRHEYVPLVLDDVPVTSDGIEMEMDEFSPAWKKNSLQASSEDLISADDSTSTFEQVPFLTVHHADPFRFTPSVESTSRGPPIPAANVDTRISTNSTTISNSTEFHEEIRTPGVPSHPKLRPAPLPLPLPRSTANSDSNFEPDYGYESARLTQPLPIQDHFCVISDSPLSLQSFDVVGSWPGTPILIPAEGRRMTILFWTGSESARSSVSVVRPGTAGSGRSEYRSLWW